MVYTGVGCLFAVDVYCITSSGTFLYQAGATFNASGTSLTVNGPLTPDSVYFLTVAGTTDPIDGSFSPRTIPTLGPWALAALVLLLLAGGVFYMRKRRHTA